METEIDFYTQMSGPYIVIVKELGFRMEDFAGGDYAFAHDAYKLAVSVNRYEWVALVEKFRPDQTKPATALKVLAFHSK